jgi:serine/threonine-protein kinase HipA
MKQKYVICPITYEPINDGEKYSTKGLRRLSAKLKTIEDLPSAEEQRIEAVKHADKMSIQGVQAKLSAKLNTKTQSFEVCDIGGNYILKPQNKLYSELPENEDLSMRMAESIIEVPLHGLLYSADGDFTYFIKRFDRVAYGNKLPVEDFAQLAGLTRDIKYEFSMEKLIPIIEKYCTFPAIEKAKFFIRIIFNYLIANEDMHVKNFSLITHDKITELAPAYDFINTTIAIGNAREEIALPLNGKKNNLARRDLVEYYGVQRLGLNTTIVNDILKKISDAIPLWKNLIEISFLSEKSKIAYQKILDERIKVLSL